jgi:hypothetical protein
VLLSVAGGAIALKAKAAYEHAIKITPQQRRESASRVLRSVESSLRAFAPIVDPNRSGGVGNFVARLGVGCRIRLLLIP